MKAMSYTAARENLAATMDQVCEEAAPVTITRNRDRAVVMMSLKEYEALEETAYLLRSPRNALALFESIRDLEAGKGKVRKLIERRRASAKNRPAPEGH
jgi:antitoxin YefM